MYRESQIEWEGERYWVLRKERGYYEVLQKRATHSVVCGTYHFSSEPEHALSMALERCKEWDANPDPRHDRI